MRLTATLALIVSTFAAGSTELRGLKHPALSPDGSRLAFSYHGDIWICPSTGGPAERITTDPADEQSPCWSPDGKSIAFSTDKAGNRDIHIVDLETKATRVLTIHSSDDDHPAWSPDGAWIAFDSSRDSNLDLTMNNDVKDVWRVPSTGGTPTRITRFRGENPAWSPDSKQIAYDRYSSGYADGEHNLFVINADGSGIPREIASGIEDSRRPSWKGNTIYFSHEANGFHRSGQRNVWRAPAAGGPLVQLTGLRTDHVTWPTTCATDTLVFEYDFDLYSINLKAKPPIAPTKLKITAENPYKDDATATKTYTAGLRQPAWSPDGAKIAGILEGDVVVMDADGSNPSVTPTQDDEYDVAWAGRDLLFVRAGHVWLGEKQLTKDAAPYRNPVLSPDGGRLAVEVDDSVHLIELATGKGAIEKGSNPAWSPNSKTLAIVRDNEILLNGKKLDTNRSLKGRLRFSPDGKSIAYAFADLSGGAWNVAIAGVDGGVKAFPADSNTTRSAPSWSPDGSMILCEENRTRGTTEGRETLWIRDVKTPATKLQVKFSVTRPWSRRDEMLAIFTQTWNAYSTNYYDPFFHGVDWGAMREKYRPLVADAQTKAELYELINDMIDELRSSHVHLTPPAAKNTVVTGMIGADVERVEDGFKLVRIEPNGPAAKAGLKEGDILHVKDLDAALTGTAIAEVDLGGVKLTPITRAQLRELKYENQIARAKAYVKEKSEGRLGYHHIKMMMMPEVTRIKTALEKEMPEVQALVLDIRDGVGGMTHKQVIHLLDSGAPDRINKAPVGFIRFRNGSTQPDRYGTGTMGGRVTGKSFDKPVIMIQNEISRSDKEILPWTFRAAGVGYLVGMPTAGGVIGGNDWTLRDGAKITVSAQGWFTSDGRNLEGWGVPPDYRVPVTHEDLYAGRDVQLEKAVEVLLAQLDGKVPAPRK